MRTVRLSCFTISVLFLISVSCTEGPQEPHILPEEIDFFIGEVKWNPDHFSPPPEWAPFEMKMQVQKDIEDGNEVLDLTLLLHNPSTDSVYLWAQSEILFDFVILQTDSTRVWNRFPYHMLRSTAANIVLEPGETRTFQETWDFTNYEDELLKPGTYLIYGGIERLNISDNQWKNSKKLYDHDSFRDRVSAVGVGVGPDTLVIE